MIKLKPCFCCGSEQVQYCTDSNNPGKDIARCRDCKAQAPVKVWDKRELSIGHLRSLFEEYENWNCMERSDGLIIHTDALDDFLEWIEAPASIELSVDQDNGIEAERYIPGQMKEECAACGQGPLVERWACKHCGVVYVDGEQSTRNRETLSKFTYIKREKLEKLVSAAEEVIVAPDNTTTALRKLKLKEILEKF